MVFHLAAAVGVELIVESPVRTIETNVHCTEIVLAEANKKKKPVFIASTSEVYGKSDALPFREDGDLLLGPPTPDGGPTPARRPSTSTWPWPTGRSAACPPWWAAVQHRGAPPDRALRMVVPTFVRQALAGQPLTVYGDGSQRRCFCHVKDAVAALIGLMSDERAHGEVFNVGSTEEVTMLELAGHVRDAVGSDSEIVTVPYQEAYGDGFEDMQRRIPDTTKVEELLGWSSTRDLAGILRDVVEAQRAMDSFDESVPDAA